MKAPLARCDICSLTKSKFVPSELHDSKVCLLGEAPGYNETLPQLNYPNGRPFAGVAGDELNKILNELGKNRDEVNILNAVSCRPFLVVDGKVRNRTPTIEEINCCNDRLIAELKLISPTVIVTMGRTAYLAMGGDAKALMRDVVGTHFIWKDMFEVYITYHPAAIIHGGGVNATVGRTVRDKIKEQIDLAFQVQQENRQLRMFE